MRVNVIALLGIFTGLMPLSVFAGVNSSLLDDLSTCLNISNDNQRLACFDQLANSSVTVLSPIKMSDESLSKIEQIKLEEAKKIDDFSKEDLKKTEEEKGPDSITATISKVKQLIRGEWVVYLENGQKWQQQDSARIKLKVGDSIRLNKGSLGAVYLFKEGSHRNIRVKRLK